MTLEFSDIPEDFRMAKEMMCLSPVLSARSVNEVSREHVGTVLDRATV